MMKVATVIVLALVGTRATRSRSTLRAMESIDIRPNTDLAHSMLPVAFTNGVKAATAPIISQASGSQQGANFSTAAYKPSSDDPGVSRSQLIDDWSPSAPLGIFVKPRSEKKMNTEGGSAAVGTNQEHEQLGGPALVYAIQNPGTQPVEVLEWILQRNQLPLKQPTDTVPTQVVTAPADNTELKPYYDLEDLIHYNEDVLLAHADDEVAAGSPEYCTRKFSPQLTPDMTEGEKELGMKYAARYANNGDGYFEWGCGGSTDIFTRQAQTNSVSVENNPKWCAQMLKLPYVQCRTKVSRNMQINCVDTGPVAAYGKPANKLDLPKFQANYVNEIEKHGNATDPNRFFGFVFIDGRSRVACGLKALDYVDTERSVVLVHDYERLGYHELEDYYRILDWEGRMVVLQKKRGVQEVMPSITREFVTDVN